MRLIEFQPASDKHLDHLEKAILRAGVQATALIQQSRREVERARRLLNDNRNWLSTAQHAYAI